MKDEINNRGKFRENWRPFSMSVLHEYRHRYLKKPASSPFMIMAFDVPEAMHPHIQSAMHGADKTTRPQTVQKDTNPLFWGLINEFYNLTGVPGLLNTSFNIKGEPIVCSPDDALRTFYSTGMDVLVMGSFIIEKGS